MRINDLVFGVVLILAEIAILVDTSFFPSMPGQDFGPALFPNLIGVGFALCGIALIISGARDSITHGLIEVGEWARSGGHILDVGLVIGGLILLIAVWDFLGFLIAGTIFTAGLIARFRGGKWVSSIAIAVIACFIVDISFRRLLLVPLPLGPLTGIYW